MDHKPTLTDTLEFPTNSMIPRSFLGVGIVGLIATAAGYFLDSQQFFFSYLVSFAFFTGLGISGILMIMLHHITASKWGVVVRRIPEAMASNMWIWAIAVIPVILALFSHDVFHWTHDGIADPDSENYDKIVKGKLPYLNTTFFIIRQVIYFAIWGYLGRRLYQYSVQMDKTGDWSIFNKMKKVSAVGIPLLGLSIAFASFDWLMSLDPHWFSTMFGVYYFAISFQAFWAIMILIVFLLQRQGLLKNTITRAHVYDLGAWLFAFTVFYAYIAFSQFMLIYYANLPEETLWYYHRMEGGWQYIMYGMLAFRFVLPFFVLLNRSAKLNRTVLGFVASVVLIMHFLEIYWIANPMLNEHGVHFNWMDFTAFIGLGGIFLGLFFNKFRKEAMIPKNDPKLDDCLAKTFHN
ncbi:MAG: hypothetical protein AAFW89_07785 [Bacteroidota bacterium]